MRGLYTATLLRDLTRWFSSRRRSGVLDLGRGFDLIAGTSTGGILAAGLAAGVDIARIVELYRVEGPKLFADPIPAGKLSLLTWIWRHLTTPANDSAPLRDALTKIFGEKTLEQLWDDRGIGLCIPAVDARTHQPRVFKTPHDPLRRRDDPWSLVNVCLATSAAPIVLPLAEHADPVDEAARHAFADGGLWANNPVLVGLVEALRIAGTARPVRVLSIGTCCPPVGRLVEPGGGWGLIDWRFGMTALEMSLDAQATGHHHMAQLLSQSLSSDCVITRLPDPPISADHSSLIGLDQANDNALRALADLAVRSSNNIMSEVTRGTPLGNEIAAFFDELPDTTAPDTTAPDTTSPETTTVTA